MKLSLCMIVKNEEKNMDKCLRNIKDVVDEIIVVDTGSEDNTPLIAKRLGAKVYYFKWCDDFSAARNESLKYATGDYIMYIDADDRISKDDADKILRLKKELPEKKDLAYALKIVLSSPEAINSSAYQIRIFPNLPGIGFEYPIHEQIVPSLRRKSIKGVFTDIKIEHKGYEDPELLKEKAERNLRVLKRMISKDPDNWFAHYFLAQTYEVLEKKDLYEFHLKRSLTKECKELDENWFIGASLKYSQLLLEKGNRKEARKLLLKLEEEFPDHDIIKFFLAEMDMKIGNYMEALNRYITIRENRLSLITIPMDEERVKYKYHFHLGQCYEKLGYNRLAMDSYNNAYKFANSEELKKDSIIGLINLFIRMDRLNDAIPYIKELIKLESSALSYSLLALAYIKEKRYEKAKNILIKAISMDPDYYPAQLRLAEIYIYLDRYDDAEEILNQLLDKLALSDQDRLTALLMSAFIHISHLDMDKFINDTDMILRHLNIRAFIGSFQDLYSLYTEILTYSGETCSYWIEKIKNYLDIFISGLQTQSSEPNLYLP